MKRSNLVALAFAAALSLSGVGAALAAPVDAPVDAPYCYNTATVTYDMAGQYYAPEIPAAIEVNNCGGVQIAWDNSAGRHNAFYGAIDRLNGGGFIARADEAQDGVFPNGAKIIGIKPAERGFLQLITTNENRDITGVYRLEKVR